MLVLHRKQEEVIVIGKEGEIRVQVLQFTKGGVVLGVKASKETPVHREEIYERIKREEKTVV